MQDVKDKAKEKRLSKLLFTLQDISKTKQKCIETRLYEVLL